MTCTKNDLIGLFTSLEKDEDKINALNEQIKVIKNGPQGMNAEIKKFAKDYETSEQDVKDAYKYYKKKRDSAKDTDSEDFFTLCIFIDEELGEDEDTDPNCAIDKYGNVKDNG